MSKRDADEHSLPPAQFAGDERRHRAAPQERLSVRSGARQVAGSGIDPDLPDDICKRYVSLMILKLPLGDDQALAPVWPLQAVALSRPS
jgi:hypothetical protein